MSSSAISIKIDPNDPDSIRRALNTEWLLTNGLGGYAMGTVLGVNTRRYHGLLVAATTPPVGRIVALHSMIEQLIITNDDGTEDVIDLSTQQFVGPDGEPMLHPGGWRLMRRVEIDRDRNTICSSYEHDHFKLEKTLHIGSDFNGASLSFDVKTDRRCTLLLRPLVPLRDFHGLDNHQRCGGSVSANHRTTRVHRDSHVLAVLESSPHSWHAEEVWWNQFTYARDRERGQEWQEDIWSPGVFRLINADRRNCTIGFLVSEPMKVPALDPQETAHQSNSLLSSASSEFVIRRQTANAWFTSVIAGYPWFGDWGRDTMIAMPGLMLCTKRFEEASSCLTMFAKHLKNGLIPNLFDDYGGAAHYNTVDASLWFVHAVHEYWKAVDEHFPRQSRGLTDSNSRDALINACRNIIAAYQNGTDFNIRMDEDGLITAGDETTQLTWMDAKRDGVVFTPRFGKAVEINALWHNALCCLAEMTDDSKERERLNALSRKAAKSFQDKFWWNDRQCLFDVLGNHQLRPNQIFAVSLPFSPLDESQQRAVLKIVGERLLTPFGLRTLDRDDPSYRGRYEGNMFERDRAYHNGTVWPWLIGPYCEALLRINKFSADAKRQAAQIIQPLIDEMSNVEGGRCLGQIAEVYDGDPPHRPNGCSAQAWSVAEVLRITNLVET